MHIFHVKNLINSAFLHKDSKFYVETAKKKIFNISARQME